MTTAEQINSTEFPRLKKIEELEGKCHALWLYTKGQTEEWNGSGCDCEFIQGNLNCKLNPF